MGTGLASMTGAVVNLDRPAHYIHWGWLQISLPNLVVIVLMIAVFVLAIVVPFPGGKEALSADGAPMWTERVRRSALKAFPPEQLLPDKQPVYVSSWIYVFGVLTIASFAVILASGVVLSLEGPTWWHTSKVGLFFNSMHLWSVELFFFFMVIHLWGKFFMGAWRGGRAMTWVTGGLLFLASIGCAFTGYVSQQNFDSQWIAGQAKDGLNAVGIGAFFNVLNFGQMFMWHILLLPVVIGAFVMIHVLVVRKHGVVPPYPARMPAGAPTALEEERTER